MHPSIILNQRPANRRPKRKRSTVHVSRTKTLSTNLVLPLSFRKLYLMPMPVKSESKITLPELLDAELVTKHLLWVFQVAGDIRILKISKSNRQLWQLAAVKIKLRSLLISQWLLRMWSRVYSQRRTVSLIELTMWRGAQETIMK